MESRTPLRLDAQLWVKLKPPAAKAMIPMAIRTIPTIVAAFMDVTFFECTYTWRHTSSYIENAGYGDLDPFQKANIGLRSTGRGLGPRRRNSRGLHLYSSRRRKSKSNPKLSDELLSSDRSTSVNRALRTICAAIRRRMFVDQQAEVKS